MPAKKKKKAKPSKNSGLKSFLRSPQFAILRGSFYMLLAFFATIALTSHYLAFMAASEGMEPVAADNWCGTFGGWLSDLLASGTFGVSSFGLCFLLFLYGMRLVGKQRAKNRDRAPRPTLWLDDSKFRKTLWSILFWVMWLSTTIGWVTNPKGDGQSLLATAFSGVVGAESARMLFSLLHIGLPILLLFLACLFLVLVHNVHIALPERAPRQDDDSATAELEAPQNRREGFLYRLFHLQSSDDDDEEDCDDEGAEYEENSHIDEMRNQRRQGNEESNAVPTHEEAEIQPCNEQEQSDITFNIDDRFDMVNSRAGHPGTAADAAENDPLFMVNDIQGNDNGQDEPEVVIPDEDEEDYDPEDYRVHYGTDEPYDPKLDLKDFQMPSTDFLEDWERKNVKVTNSELVANKDRIVDTLRNYGIEITEITASPGPTVTLYEIKPAAGVRISKIKGLENDIALSLAALGIRIIAPIPGKGTIGIEVPNTNPQIVSMKTMLTSPAFINSKAELPVAFGKTISNDVFVTDLAKMPHLLMAGATGTGKSVGLNAVIASLLYKKHPAELKFVMVDPKKVELSLYNTIERHYLAKLPDSEEAIITDVKKVVRTLNSLCIEMDQRYDLLKSAKVRNIQEYNPKFISRHLNPDHGHRFLPYIVVVIDEFADLIMTAGKEVELPICRLAQLARAVGIHLIIATQRPTTNIITGAIKANFPARIAFRVISTIDSRTILDTAGANQLIGRGDMLISLAGKDLVRCQCALIETEEIDKLAHFIGEQRGYAEGEGFMLPEYLDENDEPNKEFDAKMKDEFFNDAARLVVASQFGSTSLLQRKLSLGYNRAGRIIDQLEAAGIVGPYNGSKARDVLIKDEVSLEELLRNL